MDCFLRDGEDKQTGYGGMEGLNRLVVVEQGLNGLVIVGQTDDVNQPWWDKIERTDVTGTKSPNEYSIVGHTG